MGETACVYGLARLELARYEELERLHAEGMKDRPSPFLPPA
jgi:hypothetical protein